MHRHGYEGRKLHRDSAQRKALMRGFAISLIEHGKIETTLPRAKELVPFIEPIITKAKRGDLASRRAVLSALDNQLAMRTLVDQLAPQNDWSREWTCSRHAHSTTCWRQCTDGGY